MAAPNPTPTPSKLLHIDAIQTVTPGRVSEPGRSRRISVAARLRPEILQGHTRVILYYEKGDGEESALVTAAWIKESLSAAVSEEPLLAGRLRRDEEGDGCWEIKFNDSGVRLVQASAETTMSEFLGSKERDGREGLLASWVDVDGENPHHSALFYIQVTQFQGDGYSIGISCSLLLADPLFLARFLNSWARTHTRMLALGQLSQAPMFHLGHFQRPNRPTRIRSTPLDSAPTTATTVLFRVARARGQGSPSHDELATLCLREAARRMGMEAEAMCDFTLVISDHAGELKIEPCSAKGPARFESFDGPSSVARWDELGMEEVSFGQGSRPIHVSYRVAACGDEGSAMAMAMVMVMLPSDEEDSSDVIVSTTIPKKI